MTWNRSGWHKLLLSVSYSQAVFTVVQELLREQDEQSAPAQTKCVHECFCLGPDWLGSLTSCIPDHRKSYAGRAQQQAGTDCFCARTWHCRASGAQETTRRLWEQLCTKLLLPRLMKLTPLITQQALDYSEPIIGCIYRGMGVPVFE